jgi:hypothetical protein
MSVIPINTLVFIREHGYGGDDVREGRYAGTQLPGGTMFLLPTLHLVKLDGQDCPRGVFEVYRTRKEAAGK